MSKTVAAAARCSRDDLHGVWAYVIVLPVVTLCGLFWKFFGPELPACQFLSVTGIPCLTCGMNRGVSCLLAGNIREAFLMNPLTVFLPLALGVWWWVCVLRLAGWASARRACAWFGDTKVSARLREAVIFVLLAIWGYEIWAHFARGHAGFCTP